MGVRKNLALIFKYLKLNLQKEAQYKTSFILQIVMMIANNAFFIIQWLIIFSITDDIGGYGLNEVLLIWGIAAGGFGVAHLFFEGVFNLSDQVYNGKLDVFLTQPKNVLINVACSKCTPSAIGDILYVFVVLIIIGAPWWWYFAAIPVIILGGLIYASMVLCYQTLSFHIKKGDAIANMANFVMTGFNTYPPVIFNIITKVVLYTIVPAGFMVFVPVEHLFLGFNIWWLLGVLGVTIFIVSLAFILFKWGLKKYNSGNLMGGRL